MKKTITDIIEQMRKDMDDTRKQYTRKLYEDLDFITDNYLYKMENLLSVIKDEYLYKMDKAIRLIENNESEFVKNARLIEDTHVAYIDMFEKEKRYANSKFLVEWRDHYTYSLNTTLLELKDDDPHKEYITKCLDKHIDILHDALMSCHTYERSKKEYEKIKSDLTMELFCGSSL